MQKRLFNLLFIVSSIFVSCNKNDNEQALTCEIYPIDFVDIIDIEGTVEAVNSVTYTCPRRIEGELVYLVEDGTHVSKGDTVCIIKNKDLESDLEQTLLRVEDSKADLVKSIANLDMQYAMLQAEVQSNETQTLIQKLDSLQLNYVSETQRKITELELKKAHIQRQKLLDRLEALEVINKAEIKKRKLSIQRDEMRVQEVKDKLAQMILVSSQDGMAVRAISWLDGTKLQEGDQVWGNMPIVTIPDLSEVKVLLFASEINYKQIEVGDKVEFEFDAMPSNKAYGKIAKKAPVGQPIARNSKVRIFEIEASVDSFNMVPEPGLSAKSKIFLQNIKDTIVVPQISIFEEDSISVVYVKNSNTYERREIEIAEKSQKYAVVSNGLSGNECVALIKPKNIGKIKTYYLKANEKDLGADTIKRDTILEENTNAE